MEFTFSGEVWIYLGEGAWYFVTLPNDLADEIDLVSVCFTLADL